MNYAEIKYNDIANGEGVRTALFVSGCRHHCPQCFNAMTWDFQYGKPYTAETEEQILASVAPYWINGLSLLGGEPFEPENQEALLGLLEKFHARYPQKDVWCYTGFTLEEILGQQDSRAATPQARKMLEYIDVLVDGKYEAALHDIRLKFRGSANQRVIDVKKTLENGKIILHLE